MRAIWVTAVPPDRRGGGGHIRQAHLLRSLAERVETELLVAGHVHDPWVREPLAAVTEIPVAAGLDVRFDAQRRLFDLRHAAMGRRPREVIEHDRVRARLAPALAKAGPADLVLVEYAGLAPLIEQRPQGGRWVLTWHNLGSQMAAQAAAFDTARRRRWLYRREAALCAAFERRMSRAFDVTIAVSEQDANVLRGGAPDVDVAVVDNGVDVAQYTPTPRPEAPVVLFTGALYTAPNIDGVAWFANTIAPVLRQRRPDVQIVVAGADPARETIELCRRTGIDLRANVASMDELLRAARVAVVPLRIGSGSRLKALEAFAAGRPVVGTTIGLEGLDIVAGTHALVADDARSFAAAVVRLLDDAALGDELAGHARTLVEKRYDWGVVTRRFVDLVLEDRCQVADMARSAE